MHYTIERIPAGQKTITGGGELIQQCPSLYVKIVNVPPRQYPSDLLPTIEDAGILYTFGSSYKTGKGKYSATYWGPTC